MNSRKPGFIELPGRSEPDFAPFRFVIVADPHLGEWHGVEKFAWAADRINAEAGVEFVLLLGDILFRGPVDEIRRAMSRLRAPCLHILGNNDRDRVSEYQQQLGPLYYAFEFRSCLFVGLWNAALFEGMGDHQGQMDEAQIAWVQQTLQDARSRSPAYQHIFLFSHCPLRDNWRTPDKFWMRPDLAERWLEWCRRFDVAACFFGHTHFEERLRFGRTDFITTGSLNWNFDATGLSDRPFWEGLWQEVGCYRTVDVTDSGVADTHHRIDWAKQGVATGEPRYR